MKAWIERNREDMVGFVLFLMLVAAVVSIDYWLNVAG